MEEVEKYANETVPIYRCPSCNWKFALAEVPVMRKFSDGVAKRAIQ